MKRFLILGISVFLSFLFSCQIADLTQFPNGNLDNSTFTGPEGFPSTPEALSTGVSTRALSAANDNEYGGVTWGSMLPAFQVCSNYNARLEWLTGIEEDLITSYVSDTENVTRTEVTTTPYKYLYEGTWKDIRFDLSYEFKYWTNDGGTIVSLVTSDVNGGVTQFDYFREESHKYGRVIFYNRGAFNGVDYEDMIDVTEVWEYNDRKEVNTSRQYEIAENGEYLQFVAISELLSGKEKTTGIFSQSKSLTNLATDQFLIDVGIIDLDMTSALLGSFSGNWDQIPSDYPYIGDVSNILTKVVTPEEVKNIQLDKTTLNRYTGFDS